MSLLGSHRRTPTEEESLEILEGAKLGQELECEVAYGEKKGRDDILERLKALFRHWRANLSIEGTAAVEEESVRVQFPGSDLPRTGCVKGDRKRRGSREDRCLGSCLKPRGWVLDGVRGRAVTRIGPVG